MTTTSTLADGVPYLSLASGLIGSPDVQQLLASVDAQLGDPVIKCALDRSAIRYINSTGIGALVSLLTKFRSRGGALVLINPADHPKKMLALTKLHNIFAIAADEATARQQLLSAAN